MSRTCSLRLTPQSGLHWRQLTVRAQRLSVSRAVFGCMPGRHLTPAWSGRVRSLPALVSSRDLAFTAAAPGDSLLSAWTLQLDTPVGCPESLVRSYL